MHGAAKLLGPNEVEITTVDDNGGAATRVVRADAMVTRAATADKNRIDITLPGGLLPNTTYVITATPHDSFGVAAPAPITFTFTTGA